MSVVTDLNEAIEKGKYMYVSGITDYIKTKYSIFIGCKDVQINVEQKLLNVEKIQGSLLLLVSAVEVDRWIKGIK